MYSVSVNKNLNQGMVKQIFSFLSEKDFLNKLKVTMYMLVFYRILSFIPIPGIDQDAIIDIFSNTGVWSHYFDLFFGSGLERLSIMAIGISSYISATMLFQFLAISIDYFKELRKDGIGRARINSYTKYVAFLYAFFSSIAFSYLFYEKYPKLILFPGLFFNISTALIVACGSLMTVWIAEQISSRGIGNGSSIIIFTNIIIKIPSSLKIIIENLRNSSLSMRYFLLYLLVISLILLIVTFVERIVKEIILNNIFQKKIFSQNLPKNCLTIKFNPAGIYPAMFLSSFTMIPFFIMQIWDFSQYKYGAIIYQSLQNHGYYYVAFSAFIIFLTSHVFAEMLFNPEEKAKEFRSRSLIPGQKPGISTEEFLKNKIFYMSFYGAVYLVCICCIPSIIHIYMKGVYTDNIYKNLVDLFNIHGTSIVIVVGVANDFIDKINAGLQSKMIEYTMKLLRKGKGF